MIGLILRRPLDSAALALFLFLTATIAYYRHEAHHWEAQAVKNAFAADSAEALLDTTRNVTSKEIASLGEELLGLKEQIQVFQRRAVQTELKQDALDKALKQSSAARAELELRLATITGTVHTDSVSDSADVRTASFDKADSLITLHADVSIGPKGRGADMKYIASVAPLRIEAVLGCSVQKENGIRPATFSVVAQSGISIGLTNVRQERRVCNPYSEQSPYGWFLGAGPGFSLDQHLRTEPTLNVSLIYGRRVR